MSNKPEMVLLQHKSICMLNSKASMTWTKLLNTTTHHLDENKVIQHKKVPSAQLVYVDHDATSNHCLCLANFPPDLSYPCISPSVF